MYILNHKSYQYAKDVVDGKIVSAKYIKKACQNFIDDVHDPACKYFIDEEKLSLITNLTKLINMADGLRVGQSAYESLVGFQWFFLVNALCWYHKDNKEKRRYEKSVLLIARKSGKSFLTALLILILMILEPKNSEFYSVAPDRELSSIVKNEIAKMLEASPLINKKFKTVRAEVRFELKNSKFIPLAYSENRLDGRKANVFVADEVGALKTRYPISAMESSQMNMVNRAGILISTAYESLNNPMTEEVEYAEKVLDGLVEDETLFALLYKPDDIKDWLSDEALLQANPLAIELPENLEQLKKQRKKAMEIPSEETNFKTKHMNIFVDGIETEVYVSTDDLRKGKLDEPFDWEGRKVHIGVDLSQTNDNTAVSMVTYDEENDKFITKVWAFLPEGNIETKNKLEKIDYRIMQKNGFCFFSGNKVINYGDIERFVMDLEDTYKVTIGQIGYDRYNAMSSVNKWDEASYVTVEVKQHSSYLHPATKLLKETILNEKFHYESNRLFEINVANAREVKDNNLNSYVNKKKSKGKIDMLAALINAMYLWNLELLEGKSIYEDRGLIML
ncbi:terminase [Bacillus thuringiensis]|uniref:terminase large subunit n=1 Tax=Bacillus thuringiensis TaxID=1428 RepID=UPI000BFDCD15|nr:terminase TerL endonuclease subunit [Bacillus thuringiensis]PGQ40299.1 terminase [Bacillus thuringiensis]